MFRESIFSVAAGDYFYAKVNGESSIDGHFMIAKDGDETTVVTEERNLSKLAVIEKNGNAWKLIALKLTKPFVAGTLAAINTACAKNGLNNLVVSTYSKDYLLVKKSQLKKVKSALSNLGFRESI